MHRQGKLIFANQLRGLAAIMVVIAHLNTVFWRAGGTVATYIGAPPLNLPYPSTVDIFVWAYFNIGVIGVGIFFLISGFVIPLALDTLSRPRFLYARFFRIYPTYIVSLSIGLFAVWLSCRYWGNPFMWNARDILKNMLLVHTISGSPTVDLVNWTLAIEVKFYIIACLMAKPIRQGRVLPLILFALAIFVINTFSHRSPGTEMLFVGFMFIGILFNFKLRKLIDNRNLVLSISILCILFFGGWRGSPWPNSFIDIAPNYAYAIVIFSGAFFYRNRFRNMAVLDFLADISYPLYITHSLIGYSAMRYMYDKGMTLPVIAPVTMVLVLLVGYLIHRLVELPSTAMGKRNDRFEKLFRRKILTA